MCYSFKDGKKKLDRAFKGNLFSSIRTSQQMTVDKLIEL